ncbi:MAG: transcription antitermination factor NusB [Acidobacteriota bacterium]
MGVRRQGRECALQMLFTLDITGDAPLDVMGSYFAEKTILPEVREFASRLFVQAHERRREIDTLLESSGSSWRLERMAVVDRNILRLSVGEMLGSDAAPPTVVINEAIEIAKKFSGPEAAQFINGVLDAVRRRIAEEANPTTAVAPPLPTSAS